MQITAAVVEQTGANFTIKQANLAEPRGNEVVVKIKAVGLCHTDLSAASGATPFPLPGVLGHEGAGIVEAIGANVTSLSVGDKVVLSFTSCGLCRACRNSEPVYCEHWVPMNLLGGSRLDGTPTLSGQDGEEIHGHFFGQSSFASHVLVAEHAAVKVPDDTDLTVAAPMGCSVQTGAGAVFNVARPDVGSSIVVFGAGGVGLVAVMAAAQTPAAKVIVVDINEERLNLARELGATHAVHGATENLPEVIRSLTDGVGADYAIETSGRVSVLENAISSLASAGTCVVIGAPPLGTTVPIDVTDLLGRGIRILGTNQGDSDPRRSLHALLGLHREGKLPFDRLISTYPFSEINAAAADAKSGRIIKAVLVLPD
jgi:aryl-alcohol dehydrogenase